jgi:two-component system, cell cycle sensor histidine kinase and response regulator CckA
MGNTLRRWLNDTPIHDPIERQQAPLLQMMLLSIILVAILRFLLSLLGGIHNASAWFGAGINLLALLVAAAALSLIRHSRFRAAVLLATTGFVLVIGVMLLGAGLHSSGLVPFAFAIPITLAGLLAGRRGLLLTGGTSVAIVALTAFLELRSPPLAGFAPLPNPPADMALTFAMIVGLLVLFLDFFGRSLREVLVTMLDRDQDLERARISLQNRTAELTVANADLEHEIAERQRAEIALRDSEAQYRNLFENNPQPMWVYDIETLRFLAVNNAAIQHYGYTREEFFAMTIEQIRPPEYILPLRNFVATISSRFHSSGDWKHQKKDGTLIAVKITSHGLVFAGKRARLVLASDITERKKLEAQFLQAQKMESIGRLAGGVAHDFNNLLTAIMGNLELALDTLPDDHIVHTDLAEAHKAANRAADLTRQLLAFARKQAIEPRVINLNDLIAEMDKLLRRLIGADIELVTLPAPDLAPIKADPGQIEQVIVNLAVNARDAMPEGGKLMVETRNVEIDQTYTQQHVGVAPGAYVLLAVSDTGVGMDAETLRQIFEPFFTTKPKGRGTGLGLATCYGIVKQHGGHIWPYSEPGQGSTFRIYLPLADEPTAARTAHREPDALPRGTETVLLAEDEAAVRVLAARVLRERGYTVLEASDGDEALRLANERAAMPIDLLLTDVVMPRMSGKVLVEQVGAIYSGIKVLYISGYADHAVVHHGRLDPGVDFLHKPFSPSTLARKVREVLDSTDGQQQDGEPPGTQRT